MPIPGPYLPDEEDEDELWSAMADPRLYAQASPPARAQQVADDAVREVTDAGAAMGPPDGFDQTFTVDEAENAPDMTITPREAEDNSMRAELDDPTLAPQSRPRDPRAASIIADSRREVEDAWAKFAQEDQAKHPDMEITPKESEDNSMVAELDDPSIEPMSKPSPDMEFTLEEAENAPDQTITPDEAEGNAARAEVEQSPPPEPDSPPSTADTKPVDDDPENESLEEFTARLGLKEPESRPAPEWGDDEDGGEGPLEFEVAKDEPGMFEGNEELMWAALADVVLNKGRGVGALIGANTQFKNQWSQRRIDNKLKAAQIENAHRRRRHEGETTEYQRSLMDQNKADHKARVAGMYQAAQKEKRLAGADARRALLHDIMWNPDNQLAKEFRRGAEINHGYPPGTLEKVPFGMQQKYPLTQYTEMWLADAKNQKQLDAQLRERRAIVEQDAELAPAKLAIAAFMQNKLQDAKDFQAWPKEQRENNIKLVGAYLKDYDAPISMAGQMQTIDDAGGVVPESFWERLVKAIPGAAAFVPNVPAERLKVNAAKAAIIQQYTVMVTGKAQTDREYKRIANLLGDKVYNTDEQIEAGYQVVQNDVKQRLSMGAYGAQGPISDAMRAGGLDSERWLGMSLEEIDKHRPVRPPSPDELLAPLYGESAPRGTPTTAAGPAAPPQAAPAGHDPGDTLSEQQGFDDAKEALASGGKIPLPDRKAPGFRHMPRNYWDGVRRAIAEGQGGKPQPTAAPVAKPGADIPGVTYE